MPEPCGNLTLAAGLPPAPRFCPGPAGPWRTWTRARWWPWTAAAAAAKRRWARCWRPCSAAPLCIRTDYYLPFARRAPRLGAHPPPPTWTLARLPRRSAGPRCAPGAPAVSRTYDCHSRPNSAPRPALPAGALTILEGSYAHHPALGPYTLRVFLTCEPTVQAARLQAREGGNFEMFRTRWVPLEEGYLQAYGIEAAADLVLHTDASGG